VEIFNLESEVHLTPCRKNLFAVITLFIIVLSIYANTFHASFHFDDEPNISSDKYLHFNELSWEKARDVLLFASDGRKKIYRPATRLTFAINYYFGEENVLGYHIVNLSIHFLASIFLFLFIYHSLNLPLVKAKYGPNSYSIALLATLLWAINPVQTQAVTYIVQRMASMAGLFYILSMYFYLKGRTCKNRRIKITHYFFCFVTAILAFASKENAVMLPISIFFFDLLLIQGLTKENIKKNSYLLLALILIPLALALVLAGPSIISPKHLLSGYELREYTLFERLLTEPRVILFYITLLFYPMPDRLNILHDFSISQSLIDPLTTILAILLIFFVLGIAILKSRRWPLLSYCVLFFFLNHLIESTIFSLELIYEHRNYIPSMLLFLPVAILIVRLIKFFSYKKSMQVIFSAFVTLLLVGQGHSTFMRNFVWKTSESLWLDTIDKSPNLPRPHHNLARYYGSMGDREKEITEYELALKLNRWPHGDKRFFTHYNLALAYRNINRIDKAVEHLKKAIEIYPKFPDAYNNLGAILTRQRKYDEAFDCFIKALTYNNKSYTAHHNLGVYLLIKKRLDEAISEFNKALAMEKDFASSLLGLGIAYKYKKQFVKAKHYLKKALEKNSKNIMIRLHLMETLFRMQDKESLEALLEETLDVIPPETMKTLMDDIAADNFPDQEAPDLQVILPLLGKAYVERSQALRKYGFGYLEKVKEN
jgi:tetratricopeptide (TPR) repeat protein